MEKSLFTNAEVIEILFGLEFEDYHLVEEEDLIQVCAGTWVKTGPNQWTFVEDEEFNA
jgi:hypothetical protein